jgi:hypothetical protein
VIKPQLPGRSFFHGAKVDLTGESAEKNPRRRVPQSNGRVVTSGGKRLTIGTKSDGVDCLCVPFESADQFRGGNAPDPDCLVLAS